MRLRMDYVIFFFRFVDMQEHLTEMESDVDFAIDAIRHIEKRTRKVSARAQSLSQLYTAQLFNELSEMECMRDEYRRTEVIHSRKTMQDCERIDEMTDVGNLRDIYIFLMRR